MTDLPAGPEFDRLIAEKVMGWKCCDDQSLLLQEELIHEKGIKGEEEDVIMEEIDRLVYRYGPFPKINSIGSYQGDGPGDALIILRNEDDDKRIEDSASREAEIWSPSTNIAHAWEVVEKMRSCPLNWFCLNWYGDDPRWFASFGNGSMGVVGEANTAPLAICQAALRAVCQ